ncbi:alpha/beta fold hydrolase [Phenylobacterium deserti]|uniref:Alpha/beta hydrolase n=1 Tax=Phenylobacterium deserti TaxID=1914756 RepID=A0A328AC39_9CAUL|nr:alpha/beta hydrolase [Phenylobacterium deserti]RAK50924.1 alpha/beta hydrolase [Phenylobacterium deserti]
MTLLSIIRFFTTLLSLAILGTAAYLLWSWQDGALVRDATGDLVRVRDDWRLWTGLGLLAWSFLGRWLMAPLLARKDERRTKPERSGGHEIAGASGAKLYVERHGRADGPPIIFTHGWGMDSTFWSYAKQDLGDRFSLTLWDLPGLGKSRAAEVSLPAFAADLATLIELSGRRPVVLVGHSIGGMTIQTLLRDRPELASRIAGVVLLNTTHTNPIRTMVLSGLLSALQKPLIEPAMRLTKLLHPVVWLSKWQSYLSGSSHLAHRFGFGKFVTRSQLEHVTLLSTRNPPKVEAAGDLAMLHWDATGAVRNFNRPLLVIGGDKDIVTKLEANRTIAESAPQGELKVIQGVNHLGPMERADLYNQMIADFALAAQPAVSADMPTSPAASRPEPLPREADERPSQSPTSRRPF